VYPTGIVGETTSLLKDLERAKKDLAGAKDENRELDCHMLSMSKQCEEQEWDKKKVASLEREIEKRTTERKAWCLRGHCRDRRATSSRNSA
jgi:hypothetical protein